MEFKEDRITVTTTNSCVEIEVSLEEGCVEEDCVLGGYDYDYAPTDQQFSQKYTCMICTLIQREPMITSCCGQHFCQSCLLKCFMLNSRRCPHCKDSEVQCFVNKQQRREIQGLRVSCRNSGKGCEWTGCLADVVRHEKQCGIHRGKEKYKR